MCCTFTFSLSYCFVSVSAVCAEERSEEKINEEGTSTSNSLLGSDCLCLPLNMGVVRKYEKKRLSLYIIPAHLHLPSVYIRGVKISRNEGTVMGQKGQGCMREKKKDVPLIPHLTFVL